MGDGEQEEGQVWEVVMFVVYNKVDNFIVICDCNNQQIDGSFDEVMDFGDLGKKYQEFGWEVFCMDGNNMVEVVVILEKVKNLVGQGKFVFIDMKIEMGKGVDYMEGMYKWYGKVFDVELIVKVLVQLEEIFGDY